MAFATSDVEITETHVRKVVTLHCLAAFAFCLTVFRAVDRHSHSVSDTLYGVFPFFVCTFLLLDWIGGRTTDESKGR